MGRFINKSIRYKGFNYSNPGYYFITICTKDKVHYFGCIKNYKVILNEFGILADKCWNEIPVHFSDVFIEEYVIMPNHIHGIIFCDDKKFSGKYYEGNIKDRNHEKIPIIIGSFKSGVTNKIHKIFPTHNFRWQTSYYDRIIRNEKEHYNIANYIINNPLNWYNDIENMNDINEYEEKNITRDIKKYYNKMYTNSK